MFEIDLGNDRRFVARERLAGDAPLFGRIKNTDEGRSQVVQWVLNQFVDAVRAKLPQHREMVQNELYYAGFHWADPIANRNNAVRNFCFATVETVHPILTEMRPRPQAVMRGLYSINSADKINDRLQWLMDVTNFDYTKSVNEREKLKHGWCVYLLNVNSMGFCEALPYPGYDFYPDGTATNDEEMDIYFLARPVQTDFLLDKFSDQKKYPWLFDEMGKSLIVPDNLTSAGYEALERPYLSQDVASHYSVGLEPESIIGAVSRLETNDPNGEAGQGSVQLVRVDGQERRSFGNTTFLIQCFVRDRTRMRVSYSGDICEPDPEGQLGEFMWSPSANPYARLEDTCESGWRCIQLTASGLLLDSHPLDKCYGGRNIVIDRDYPQLGRFYGPGELRNIIPINRSINRRTTALEQSLAFETNPILVMDTGNGMELDNRAVEPGDVLRKTRGSEVKWLETPSPASHHFEMLAVEKQDMDVVSGVHDVTQGRRPEGIEAAAAIRNLQSAAQTRIRGKEIPGFIALRTIAKKMLMATARKLPANVAFKADNGNMEPWNIPDLLYEYDITFAPGSGTVVGREMQEEKVMALVQGGLIDRQTALERLNVKGVPDIMARLDAQNAIMPARPAGGVAA